MRRFAWSVFRFFFLRLDLRLYRVSGGFGFRRDGRYLVEEHLGLVDFFLLACLVVPLPDGFLQIEVGLIEKRLSKAEFLHLFEGVEFALVEFRFSGS